MKRFRTTGGPPDGAADVLAFHIPGGGGHENRPDGAADALAVNLFSGGGGLENRRTRTAWLLNGSAPLIFPRGNCIFIDEGGCTGFDWDEGLSGCRWRAELLKSGKTYNCR